MLSQQVQTRHQARTGATTDLRFSISAFHFHTYGHTFCPMHNVYDTVTVICNWLATHDFPLAGHVCCKVYPFQ